MIEIPVTIEKADIPELGRMKGRTNSKAVQADLPDCNGIVYLDRTLRFRGFVGLKNMLTGKWDGVLRFDNVGKIAADVPQYDFAALVYPTPPPAAKRKGETL